MFFVCVLHWHCVRMCVRSYVCMRVLHSALYEYVCSCAIDLCGYLGISLRFVKGFEFLKA